MQDEEITFIIDRKDNIQIYRITGKLDAISTPVIQDKIFESITPENNKILFDFKDVSYMSSAGVRMIFITNKLVKNHNGKLIICNSNQRVWDIIIISQLDHFLDTTDSEEEAMYIFDKG
jgi:anti-sigma B factor antagonist